MIDLPGTIKRRAFTLIELLVVIAIIAILASLFLLRVRRVTESALSAGCGNNLRQIGLALNLYTGEFGAYPLSYVYQNGARDFTYTWCDSILPFTPKIWNGGSPRTDLFVCPKSARENQAAVRLVLNDSGTDFSSDPNGNSLSSLGLGHAGDIRNGIPIRESRVFVPAEMIAVLNASIYGGYFGFGWPGLPADPGFWHQSCELGLFCDGHVESGESARIPKRMIPYGGYTYSVFESDIDHARRWNNDHQPHPETWPKP